MVSRCRAPASSGRRVDVAGSWLAQQFNQGKDRPVQHTGHVATMSKSLLATTLSSAYNPGRLSRPLVSPMHSWRNTATNAPPKPSSGLLERLQLVLDGLTAITGRYHDIQSGASLINAAHDSRIDIVCVSSICQRPVPLLVRLL